MDTAEEHILHRASTVYFRAGEVQTRRGSSVGPGTDTTDFESEDHRHIPPYSPRDHDENTSHGGLGNPLEPLHRGRLRRQSADSSYFHPIPFSHEEFSSIPTPPYSPFPTPPTPPSHDRHTTSPHILEEFRNSLNAALRNKRSQWNSIKIPSKMF